MTGYSEAIAYGAATIVNAIASGKGAAFGVNLWTKARVQLTRDSKKIDGIILSDPQEDPILLREAVKAALHYTNQENQWGAYVETESNIPIAKGLKSSSVAANAIVLATLNALGTQPDDFTTINLGIDAAIHAKKSITGAYDDACASFFGDIILTDNITRSILKIAIISKNVEVIFFIPNKKAYTHESDVSKMKLLAPHVNFAFQQAFQGNYWDALTLNGILYSAALGFDPEPALEALRAGAIAAGLTGTGPAIVAVVTPEKVSEVMTAWTYFNGIQIRAKINHTKAHILQ